jgi:hypothetical protein
MDGVYRETMLSDIGKIFDESDQIPFIGTIQKHKLLDGSIHLSWYAAKRVDLCQRRTKYFEFIQVR